MTSSLSLDSFLRESVTPAEGGGWSPGEPRWGLSNVAKGAYNRQEALKRRIDPMFNSNCDNVCEQQTRIGPRRHRRWTMFITCTTMRE